MWWHVAGAAIVVLILIFVPDHHQSASFVFSERVNNTGGLFGRRARTASDFWFYVIPLGFLLTQYTITGFDASAHLSEETHSAADAAAKGIWRSIFYSAIGGYVLLAGVRVRGPGPERRVGRRRRCGSVIFDQATRLELGRPCAAHRG